VFLFYSDLVLRGQNEYSSFKIHFFHFLTYHLGFPSGLLFGNSCLHTRCPGTCKEPPRFGHGCCAAAAAAPAWTATGWPLTRPKGGRWRRWRRAHSWPGRRRHRWQQQRPQPLFRRCRSLRRVSGRPLWDPGGNHWFGHRGRWLWLLEEIREFIFLYHSRKYLFARRAFLREFNAIKAKIQASSGLLSILQIVYW